MTVLFSQYIHLLTLCIFFVIKVVIFLYTLQSIYITHHLHSNDGIDVMTVSDINF
jgi:hypothetical protein